MWKILAPSLLEIFLEAEFRVRVEASRPPSESQVTGVRDQNYGV